MRYQGCSNGTLSVVVGALASLALCLGTACGGTTPAGGDDVSASPPRDRTTTARVEPGSVSPRSARRHPRHARILKGTGYAEFTLCATGKSCAHHLAETTFSAQFTPEASSPADAGATCTSTTSGSCSVTTCSYASTTAMGVPAGLLTVGGGDIGSVPIPTNKFQDYVYSFTQVGAAWSAGDTITVSGSGGKVPAFAAQSLVAPGPVKLTAPLPNLHGDYKIASSAPLALTWTGGTAGNTVFVQGTSYGSTAETSFSCSWDATAGAATVPTSMLTPLAGQPGDFTWGQQTAPASFDAGKFKVAYLADDIGSAPAMFE